MPQKLNPNIVRKCKLCGDEFHPTARKQQCCNQEKQKTCAVCGKSFQYVCNTSYTRETCSAVCQRKLTKLRKELPVLPTKKCKWCGKEFTPKTVRDEYCRAIHYKTCEVCGKLFEVDVRANPYVKTCSDECRYKLAVDNRDMEASYQKLQSTLLSKYGVDNAVKIPGVIDKMKDTNQQRYGTEWFSQSDEYASKLRETSIRKYGVEHPLKSPEVREAIQTTVLNKYGTDNVSKVPEVQDKIKQTMLNKYGVEHISQNEAIKEKIRNTNIEKYGVEHPMMLPEYQEKAKHTSMEKYGREYFTQQHIESITEWKSFTSNPQLYIELHHGGVVRAAELAEEFGVDTSTIDLYIKNHDASDHIYSAKSLMEQDIIQCIKEIDADCRIITNDRTVISPQELDIYLPDYEIAIECNHTATHNSSTPDPWGGAKKSINYHLNKTKKCESRGVFLFHVFSYEWIHKRKIILSMIRNLLKQNTNKIYARQCKVVEIDSKECATFLNNNHRQGYTTSSINLGLYYNEKLVSVMTFGKMRKSIGTGKEDLHNCYELVRFCSLLNTTVIGGASKLFKHFCSLHNPVQIRSFSDRAHTSGGLYQQLGFTEIRRSDPNYTWVNTAIDVSYHRVNAQKQNIKQFLHDENIDLQKSESQIMEEHGYVKVYDSGTITWEWIKH